MTTATTSSLLKEAVHHNKATSKRGMLERMFTMWFRGFVYNQIWEDPRLDAEALRLGPGDELLTISSGGCNALDYLLHDPKRVVAVDLNHCHLSLLRLKLAALKHLPDHETFYNFFGFGKHPENVPNYQKYIRDHLDEQTRAYWEGRWAMGGKVGRRRITWFKKGFYERSKLGQFFRVSHRAARLLGVDPKKLLAAETVEDQEAFFEEFMAPLFDNRFVRWVTKKPVAVFSLGIPPSQHQAMASEAGSHIVDVYRERVKKLMCGFPMADNYFAWQAAGRQYDHEHRRAIPSYLKAEHYETIRSRVDRVETELTTLTGYLKKRAEGSMNRFVLLDAQDWMPPAVIAELWGEIARVGQAGTRVIFRTAGEKSPVEPALPPALKAQFEYEQEQSREMHLRDRSAIYGMFNVYSKRDGRPGAG